MLEHKGKVSTVKTGLNEGNLSLTGNHQFTGDFMNKGNIQMNAMKLMLI